MKEKAVIVICDLVSIFKSMDSLVNIGEINEFIDKINGIGKSCNADKTIFCLLLNSNLSERPNGYVLKPLVMRISTVISMLSNSKDGFVFDSILDKKGITTVKIGSLSSSDVLFSYQENNSHLYKKIRHFCSAEKEKYDVVQTVIIDEEEELSNDIISKGFIDGPTASILVDNNINPGFRNVLTTYGSDHFRIYTIYGNIKGVIYSSDMFSKFMEEKRLREDEYIIKSGFFTVPLPYIEDTSRPVSFEKCFAKTEKAKTIKLNSII